MDKNEVKQLVERLGSKEDGVRKMAAFKLQASIADPSFADMFMSNGGIVKLRTLVLQTNGNALAYSLTAFSKLLEVDMGWESVNDQLIHRVIELIVAHPLVNILRGAMSILASIVSRSDGSSENTKFGSPKFGFQALKPAISKFPQFLEMLISRLSSADHALCTNSLQLINSLLRNAISDGFQQGLTPLIGQLERLGVIETVYLLMQSSAIQDLAQPLLEFQALYKMLLRRRREIAVDLEIPEHSKAASDIYQASNVNVKNRCGNGNPEIVANFLPDYSKVGFQNETITEDFEDVGYLGLMDLATYIRNSKEVFQRILFEQSIQRSESRCPIAGCSIIVTGILYEHFEVDRTTFDDLLSYTAQHDADNYEKMLKPCLLQWSSLHAFGIQSFLRLWRSTSAETEDFDRVAELVRILLETVLGASSRTKSISEIKEEMFNFGCQKLRELQMELSELMYEDSWGHYLNQVRDELNHEALQFMKEQRIRCLLEGSWFPTLKSALVDQHEIKEKHADWGFVRLSHNRKFLHFQGYDSMNGQTPELDELASKIDLSTVSSVISNVTADTQSVSSSKSSLPPDPDSQTFPRIAINGIVDKSPHNYNQEKHKVAPETTEIALLTLYPQSRALAAEWLDGLLMLLKQAPITSETKKLLGVVSGWGLKIRLLNVNFENESVQDGGVLVPSRTGLDDHYYFARFGDP